MPIEIDSELQSGFFGLCERFCASSITDGKSQDITSRQSFVGKLYAYLASIDSSDSQYGYTMNYIYREVVDCDILLTDMMSYFSGKSINADSMDDFISSYSYDGNSVKSKLYRKIETDILRPVADSESSVGDIIEKDGLFRSEIPYPEGLLIMPTIACSFIESDSYFISELDALRDFKLKTDSFLADSGHSAYHSFQSLYQDLDSVSFAAFGSQSSKPTLGMMWRIEGSSILGTLTWLKRMSFNDSEVTPEEICKTRLCVSDYETVFGGLVKMLYASYARITQDYETRNSEFKLSENIGNAVEAYDVSDLSHLTFMTAEFLCLIAEKNQANLTAKQKTKLSSIKGKLSEYRTLSAVLETRLDELREYFVSNGGGKYSLR